MKKKINRYLLTTALLTLMATLCITVAIFHHMYKEQIIDDMRTYALLLQGTASSGEELESQYTDLNPELRVTLIQSDGQVIYDSSADEGSLSNHGNRPEVHEAESRGEAYIVRHSDTLDSDMYYYAVRLDNGDILRISRAAASIWNVFINTLLGIACIAAVIMVVCMILSRYITESIVYPIEKLASDIDNNIEELNTYEELVPFLMTIRQQHTDIIKSSRMRQEFTANVTHELKTPLTSISGYAELIETGIAGENEIRRFAKQIHQNARRLLTLINDILQLSELDSGQTELNRSEVDLYEVASTCVEMLQVHAENHGIHISCRGSRCLIHADKSMMEELAYNLCDNAIRYNRLGGRVDVWVGTKGGRTILSVADTGIGIPEESRERVFERFYRVDKSRSKLTGGTGLGLAIVKHIVAKHDAQIELESEVGKGTKITVAFSE